MCVSYGCLTTVWLYGRINRCIAGQVWVGPLIYACVQSIYMLMLIGGQVSNGRSIAMHQDSFILFDCAMGLIGPDQLYAGI